MSTVKSLTVWTLSSDEKEAVLDELMESVTDAAEGFAILYAGKLCGWVRDLSADRAENGRLTHIPGCLAVELRDGGAQFIAVGGDDSNGAEFWRQVKSA
jgi:hypothetical protein